MAEYQTNEELKAIIVYQAKRIIDLEHENKHWLEEWVKQSKEIDALKEKLDLQNV